MQGILNMRQHAQVVTAVSSVRTSGTLEVHCGARWGHMYNSLITAGIRLLPKLGYSLQQATHAPMLDQRSLQRTCHPYMVPIV
jgi:hypothetical protein